ncbi:ribonuclease E/G [Plastorhodobacter daqingensis]|uniref:Ribonuclease E n=1 Tax=Plastorhodobacter daqingensis TaxID=1387281 RepID=A0ABW2ULF3_9RHOB
MAKKMLIDATHAEETRVVVVDGTRVEEFDFETANKRQLAGNIYLAKVTRVEPSLQAAFVDYGGNRHGFLAFSEIHPDYYQIPTADRQALLEEERAYARAQEEEENRPRRSSRKPAPKAEALASDDAVQTGEIQEQDATQRSPSSMDVVDLGEDQDGAGLVHDRDEGDTGPDRTDRQADEDGQPYAAVDHATEIDSEIESIADEDVSEEIRQPRKPRPRRYKIQEVIKVRQIMLVQVVKEERGNKGAALTTYLSLAGRYCVLMPNTARGGGISRKITNAADRKKLKEIAAEIEVPEGAGLIVRTAGAQRTKTEIRRDYEYLVRLWEQIRELTLRSIAPAPIYEEGDLIKRSIRDLYNREIDEVLVEGVEGYRVAKDFMKMIMPSHAKNVKHYTDQLPLFARHQVESYLSGMFNPTVQLKSGGYIVIGVTEALVAIDVNSGRATKEGSIEDTALKTNLEAAEEIARQLRLRDLAGLIVIDFIDMEERKNNAAVEKKLKDKLKTDRARIQVGRISGFGLLEMSRQRLRPGMIESTTQPCPHCHGTGLIRSDDSLGLSILRQLEEEGTRKRSREVLLKAPVDVVNFLINQKREHIAQIEARYGMAVRIEVDPTLVSPNFSIEKFKTATRVVAEVVSPVVSVDTSAMPEVEEEDIEEDVVTETAAPAEAEATEGEGNGKKRKRRRRRRRGSNGSNGTELRDDTVEDEADTAPEAGDAAQDLATAVTEETPAADAEADAAAVAEPPAAETVAAETPKTTRSRSRSRSRKPAQPEAEAPQVPAEAAPAEEPAVEPAAEAAPAKPKRTRSRKTKAQLAAEAEEAARMAEAAAAGEAASAFAEANPEPAAAVHDAGEIPAQDATARAEAAPEPRATPAATTETEAEPATAAGPAAEMVGAAEPAAIAAQKAEAEQSLPEAAPVLPEPVSAEDTGTPSEELQVAGSEGETPESDRPKRRGWWNLGR